MPVNDPQRPSTTVPRSIRNELPRTALVQELLDSDEPLVLLIAPGGYGKTTLLAQCARLALGQAVWLTLCEDDIDPLRFHQHLLGAVQNVLPTLRLHSSTHGVPAALALDLANSTTNLHFYLDGLDLLHPTSQDWLGRWINLLPEGHRVYLAGRSEPQLRISQRLAAGLARLVQPAQLAFTPEETAIRLKRPLDEEVRELHHHLEGWPIAISLANGTGTPSSTRILLEEALGQLPATLQNALPDLAPLDLWSEEQAARFGLTLPAHWLTTLRRAGLPLLPQGDAYRPHQLLQQHLEQQLAAHPARHQARHAQVALQAEQSGDDWVALRHYRQVGDQAGVVRVATRLASLHERRSELRLVRQVLEPLVDAALPTNLQVLLGHALLETGEQARGVALLENLYAQGSREPALLFALGVHAARTGESERQLDLAHEGLTQSLTPREASRLKRLQTSAHLNMRHFSRALQRGREALELARAAQDQVEIGAVLMLLQIAYHSTGDLDASEAALRWARQLYRELDMPARTLLIENDLANLLREQGRLVEAQNLLQAALTLAASTPGLEEALLIETHADVLREEGHHAQAAQRYEDALHRLERLGQEPLKIRLIPRLVGTWLLAGQVRLASQAASLSPLLTSPSSSDGRYAQAFCQGLLAAYRQDWLAATQAFTRAYAEPSGFLSTLQYRACLHATYAHVQAGTFTTTHARHLEEYLQDAPGQPFHRADQPLLQAVIQASEHLHHPLPTLKRFIVTAPTPVLNERAEQPLHLHLQTLGTLNVRLNDQPIHIPLNRSAEILVWLALNGPTSRDHIISALWDDTREQRHIEYFKVAIRHLRLALSSLSGSPPNFNPVPFEHNQYRLSPLYHITTDATRASHALHTLHQGDLQAALDSYRGPFLPSSDAPWSTSMRLTLLEQTLSAGHTLAEQHLPHHPTEAAHTYERCLEIDPIHEPTHLRLIHLWLNHQQPAAARRTYQRYCTMLHTEWQRTPDPVLTAKMTALSP